MMSKVKMLCLKYRELLIYILVGGGTTLVAWGCKYLWNLCFFGGAAYPTVLQNSVLSVVENVAAIVYAYPVNRKWVFRSKDPKILPELAKFTGSRTAVWILGWLLNMLLVNVLDLSIFLSTVLVGFAGFVANYSVSKLLVFRRNSRMRKAAPGVKTSSAPVSACTAADLASAA